MRILIKIKACFEKLKNKIIDALGRAKEIIKSGMGADDRGKTRPDSLAGRAGSSRREGARWVFYKVAAILMIAAAATSLLYWVVCCAVARAGIAELWIWPLASLFFFILYLWISGRPPFGQLRKIKWLRCAVALFLALFFCFFTVIECFVASGMSSDGEAGLDYIIVLGAHVSGTVPSSALRWRIERAHEYLIENPDTLAVVSGGQGAGEDISEAECMRRELISLGIDSSRIVMEERSTSTTENISFSLKIIEALLGEGGEADAREGESIKIGIVTNNFHVWRAVRIARRAGISEAAGIAAPYRNILILHYMVREFFSIVMNTLLGYM